MRKTGMREDIYHINQKSENKEFIRFHMCGITYPDKNYQIMRKCSNIACIEYIESGTGSVTAGEVNFFPAEGDSYFLHTGIKHHYFSDKERPWKKYFVNVSGTLLESLIDGYKLNDVYHFPNLDIKDELCRIIELAKQNDQDFTLEFIEILNNILFKMRSSIKAEKNIDIAKK